MADVKVEIRGLRELQAAFKEVNADLPKELRNELKEVATVVVGKVRSKMPHLTGTARGSVTPRATQRGASIAFGGSKAPYEPWLDFGGKVGRNRSIERSFIKEGRYVYPTIQAEAPAIAEAVGDAVERAAERADFEVRGNG